MEDAYDDAFEDEEQSVDWQSCAHEWEDFDDEYPDYRNSTCMICGAYRHQDFVNNKDEISAPTLLLNDDDGHDDPHYPY